MDKEYFASINEVSKRLDIPAHTLRYWEKQFPTAIRPTTGAGGRRYYRPETIERLIVIKDLLYKHGMTIAGVKKLIHDGDLPRGTSDNFAIPTSKAQSTRVVVNQSGAKDISDDIATAISLLNAAREILTTA